MRKPTLLAIQDGKATERLRPHRTFEDSCKFEISLTSCPVPQAK
jgi:hypothetical protein